jgi:arabinose-5-phosphate isomerase
MLAIGDALALTIAHRKRFSVEQFAAFHPAGSLGRKLARVEEFMRTGRELRCAASSETVRSVITKSSRRGRRTGAVMLLDQTGRLEGLFTDSDLARLFERGDESFLDRPVAEVMTRDPWTAPAGSRMEDALELLRKNRISELPVVAQDGRPIGILDITDLVGLSQSVDGDWDANSRELQFAA